MLPAWAVWRRCSRTTLGITAAAFLLGCMTQSEGGATTVKDSPQHNHVPKDLNATVRRLGDLVEIEVRASHRFPDRAMPPVLVVGDRAFARSRNPPDGRADTLIFTMPAADFDGLPNDADVSIGYLSPSARLATSPPPYAAGAPLTWESMPRIRAEQVESARRRVGKFRKAEQEILQ